MANTEIVVEILGYTDEQVEMNDFMDYIEDRGINIPNAVQKLIDENPKYEIVLEKHVTNNWLAIDLSNLPPRTKTIRISIRNITNN
jgi:hypothetical protein